MKTPTALLLLALLAFATTASAATFTVTNTADSGAGSLRQAIADAIAAAGADDIVFDAALSGQTITFNPSSGPIFSGAAALTVDGSALASPVTISGGGASRLFRLASGTNVTLKKLMLTGGNGAGGTANGNGGAIYSAGTLAVEDCTFSNNLVTGDGGAIRCTTGAPLTVTRCTFTGNGSGTVSQFGGAIHSQSPVVIALSTFSGNTSYRGGAVRCENASLTVSQSTFTGNTAVSGGALSFGGTGGASSLTHVTITANHATGIAGLSGGGIQCGTDAGWTLENSIVSANTADTGAADIDNQDPLTYVGANLVQTVVNTGTGSATGPAPIATAPLLAALGNYGGPTQTMPPLAGSPAINAAIGSTITTDQRGVAFLGIADLGACEHLLTMMTLVDRTIAEDADQTSRTFACTINAQAYTAPAPAFSATSSNPALVTGFSFPGTNPNRQIRVTLAANTSGSALITVTVSRSGQIATDSFLLTVTGFSVPGTAADRDIRVTLAANAHGSALITVTVSRSGQIATDSFLLTVTPVNDPPNFAKGHDQGFIVNPGPQTVPGWATRISPGPADESGQTLTFTVTNDNNAFFSVQPALALDGTLTYTLSGTLGSATVTVRLSDSGGGGNFSEQTFLIVRKNPILVTNNADSGVGSLRQAVADAVASGGRDFIHFAAGLSGATITLTSGIGLNDDLTVDASSLPGGLTLSGGNTTGILWVEESYRVSLIGLSITNGNSSFGGSAISTGGTLTLTHCTLSGNSTGAISTCGTLTLTQCTLSGNSSTDLGGAIQNSECTVTLTQCTLSGNSANNGGAIYNSGTMTLTGCTLTGNTANSSGGGAIYHDCIVGTLTLTACTLSENTVAGSNGQGGAIYIYQPFVDPAAQAVTLTQCILSDNSATGTNSRGGAIFNQTVMTLTQCTLSGNSATFGGAIQSSGDTLTLTQCTLLENSATNQGGAIAGRFGALTTLTECILTGNTADFGGAIYKDKDNSGTLTLTHCTLSGNSAGGGGAIWNGVGTLTHCTLSGNSASSNYGGGAIRNNGPLTLTHCTLSGNSAIGGGAIANDGPLTLTHCTLSGNSVTHSGGAVYNFATLTLTNSLIAGNTAPAAPDINFDVLGGTITRSGVNLIGKNATVTAQFPAGSPNANGDYVGTSAAPLNPLLAPLGDYGGPTQTMRLLPGSPALNRITNPLFPTDQRGFPIVGLADIGAYENGAPTIATIADRAALSGVSTAPIAFTIGDAETAAASLTLTKTSSNTGLVPNGNIILGGSDANRTVTITPAAGQTGTATITLTVSDGANTASTSFQLTVLANTGFNAWKLATFGPDTTNPALAGDTADADNDGQPTFLEYATRSNPLAASPAPMSTPQPTGPAYQFTFPWRPGATDLRYIIQRSNNLSAWTEIYRLDLATNQITEQGNVTADENSTTQVIIVNDPDFTPGSSFWRLVVERP